MAVLFLERCAPPFESALTGGHLPGLAGTGAEVLGTRASTEVCCKEEQLMESATGGPQQGRRWATASHCVEQEQCMLGSRPLG